VVGVWGPGELVSAPTQRLLAPQAKVTEATLAPDLALQNKRQDNAPEATAAAAPVQVLLGPAMAQVDEKRHVVVSGLSGDVSRAKQGTRKGQRRRVCAAGEDGQRSGYHRTALTFSGYNKNSYETLGGISEFSFQPAQLKDIQSGALQLVQQGTEAIALSRALLSRRPINAANTSTKARPDPSTCMFIRTESRAARACSLWFASM